MNCFEKQKRKGATSPFFRAIILKGEDIDGMYVETSSIENICIFNNDI